MTISGAKYCIGMTGITIVGMVCDAEGRHLEQKKVQKIVDWPTPRNVKEARGFVGIAVYYRIFIANFSVIAAPIFKLFKKNARFRWTEDCRQPWINSNRQLHRHRFSSNSISARAPYPLSSTSTLQLPLDGVRFSPKCRPMDGLNHHDSKVGY